MSVKSPDSADPPSPGTDAPPSPRLFQWLLILLGVGVSLSVYLLGLRNVEAGFVSIDWMLLGVGVLLLALGLTLTRLPVGLTLFLASSLLASLAGLAVFAAVRLDPVEETRKLLLRVFPPKVGIWRYDPILGFANKPGAVGRFQKGEIDVEYTIDPLGFRTTPDPANPVGRIVFLGCSFTFGTGVEDEEAYPFVLGRDHWPEYKIRNRAATAYGTAHAYLSLLQELQESDPAKMVFYGWIAAHRARNSIRKTWVDHLAGNWGLGTNRFGVTELRRHPHLEVEEGRIVFKGVVGPGDLREDPADLRDREIAVTTHCLGEMNRLCTERGIPFFCVNLPTDPGLNPLEESGRIETPSFLLEVVSEAKIEYLDAQEAHRGTLPGDYHPNAETHRAIALRIAEDERVRRLLE